MGAKPKSNFGPFAKEARLKAGFGLRQVARDIGISAAYLSRVENGIEDPSGKLIENLARHYKIPIEELTSRATKPKASAAAHGRTMQASPELRALYRLGAQIEAVELAEFIRNFLREKGVSEGEIEKQLAQLKSELPRVAKNARDGLFAAEAKPRFLSKRRIASIASSTPRRRTCNARRKPPRRTVASSSICKALTACRNFRRHYGKSRNSGCRIRTNPLPNWGAVAIRPSRSQR